MLTQRCHWEPLRRTPLPHPRLLPHDLAGRLQRNPRSAQSTPPSRPRKKKTATSSPARTKTLAAPHRRPVALHRPSRSHGTLLYGRLTRRGCTSSSTIRRTTQRATCSAPAPAPGGCFRSSLCPDHAVHYVRHRIVVSESGVCLWIERSGCTNSDRAYRRGGKVYLGPGCRCGAQRHRGITDHMIRAPPFRPG